MKNEKIYILFTDTGTFFTKLIKLYTKKRYNHTSISLNAELTEVYSFGRKKRNNPFRGGFVQENVKEGLFKDADCAIYSIHVSKEQKEMMRKYIEEMKNKKEKYRYNFLGLLGFLIKRPVKRKNAFFCSQFVGHVLNAGKAIPFHKPMELLSPYDIQSQAGLTITYEGKLKDYLNERTEETMTYFGQIVPVSA